MLTKKLYIRKWWQMLKTRRELQQYKGICCRQSWSTRVSKFCVEPEWANTNSDLTYIAYCAIWVVMHKSCVHDKICIILYVEYYKDLEKKICPYAYDNEKWDTIWNHHCYLKLHSAKKVNYLVLVHVSLELIPKGNA